MKENPKRDIVSIDYGTNKDYFAVRIVSDDMKNAHFEVGAIVIVRKQSYANNGDIVLILHNGKLCFRYYVVSGNDLYLTAANNAILPVAVKETDNFLILGKVSEIRIDL